MADKVDSNTCASIRIQVVKQPIARLIIGYSWLLALLSMYALIYCGGHSTPIELSYYVPYLGVGLLIRGFFQHRIVDAIEQLHQTGALTHETYPGPAAGLDRRLNRWPAVQMFGTLGGLIIAGFYEGYLVNLIHLRWCSEVVIAVDVLFGYAGGVAIWKIIAVANEFRVWSLNGQLTMRPFHPDGAGGLAAIG
jgi:hypothetical protein